MSETKVRSFVDPHRAVPPTPADSAAAISPGATAIPAPHDAIDRGRRPAGWRGLLSEAGRQRKEIAHGLHKLHLAAEIGHHLSGTGARVLGGAAKALRPAAVAADAYNGYHDSGSPRTYYKARSAAAHGLVGALMTQRPSMAVADALAPKGRKPSDLLHGAASAALALEEALLTGETRAAEQFQHQAEKGEQGNVIKHVSTAGRLALEGPRGMPGALGHLGQLVIGR